MLDAADLPDDVAALKAMLVAAQAREAGKDAQIARKDERIERLEKLVAAFKQAAFGRKSEKTDSDQFDLALEDLETAMAVIHGEGRQTLLLGTESPRPARSIGAPPSSPRVLASPSDRKSVEPSPHTRTSNATMEGWFDPCKGRTCSQV